MNDANKISDNNFLDPGKIIEDWLNDPDRPVFLVDETRRDFFDEKDQIFLFTCVCMKASKVTDILRETRNAGNCNQKPKVGDIVRPEGQKYFASLISIWGQSLQCVEGITIVTTSAKKMKSTEKIKARLKMIYDQVDLGRSQFAEGPELSILLNLVKQTALSLQVGSRQVDIIIDRSDQFGMGPKKRKLPDDTFEVVGPAQFNRRPDGTQSLLYCPAEFRLIFNSDQGLFRDLLMLPELYGYLLLYRVLDYKTLYKSLAVEPLQFRFIDYQEWFKRGLTNDSS